MKKAKDFGIGKFIDDYDFILATASDHVRFLQNKDVVVEQMPTFDTYPDTIHHLLQTSEQYLREEKNVLFVTANQATLVVAQELGFDTCFINTGLNDALEIRPTYEFFSKGEQTPFQLRK